ncbi:hypothetical protein ACLB2K_026951 [Fragaria x ananassa]
MFNNASRRYCQWRQQGVCRSSQQVCYPDMHHRRHGRVDIRLHIGISGGVTSMDSFLSKFFPSVYRKKALDKSTNQYCQYDSQVLTMFTSSLYLAALIASVVAAFVTRKFGRKRSMFFGGVLFCVGAAINAAAMGVWMWILGQILLGFGIGFSNQSVPLYLSEMAPSKYRGRLNIMFQLSITIGILVANLVNYFFAKIDSG